MLEDLFKSSKRTPVRRKKRPACEDCGGLMTVRSGWGHCESCHRGEAFPVGVIVSKGHHKGKDVYLLSAILAEIRQDNGDEEDVDDELASRDYFVIRDIEYD